MRTKFQKILAGLSFLATTQTGAAINPPDTLLDQPIVKTINAIYSASLRIELGENLHGFIVSKNCSFCKTIKIAITPETKAYANNRNVPLIEAKNRVGRVATIIYNQETNRVKAIRW